MTADGDILHRIFERLGGIDQKLADGSRRHAEFAQGLAEIDRKTDTLTERVGKVEARSDRIPVIERTLWELEEKRIEGAAVKKFWGGVVTKGRAAVAIGGGSMGAALTAFVAWANRQFFSG